VRVLLQRVSRARVSVQEQVIAEIGTGYLLLVGVGRGVRALGLVQQRGHGRELLLDGCELLALARAGPSRG